MKIKFTCNPKGRPEYKSGDVVEFKTDTEMSYARKFLAKGWAEPVDSEASKAIKSIEDDKKQVTEKAATESAEYAQQVRSGQRGPASQFGATQTGPGK